jgi:hypothetical protein
MAQDSPNHLSYFLVVENAHQVQLGSIRHWQNLKIATEGNQIWVKDFTQGQIESIEVKCIPSKQIFYAKDGKLFPKGSLLPSRKEPSLLWSPIERGLPVHLPSFNYNFFGIEEKIDFKLVPSEKERESYALLTTTDSLGKYIETAPSVRLQKLDWLIINHLFTLILGTPLLPLQGEVFWRQGNFLIPVGYDFELYSLCDLVETMINPTGDSIVLWNIDSSYFLLEKQQVESLTLGSFRKSVNN